MIDEHSFRALLPSLGFTADASGNIFSKRFNGVAGSLFACEMRADFVKKALVYPEDSGLMATSFSATPTPSTPWIGTAPKSSLITAPFPCATCRANREVKGA